MPGLIRRTKDWANARCLRVTFNTTSGLLNNNIDHSTFHDHYFLYRLAFYPFLYYLVGEYGLFDSGIVCIQREAQFCAGLTIHCDGVVECVFLYILLFEYRVSCIKDAGSIAQHVPQFFTDA